MVKDSPDLPRAMAIQTMFGRIVPRYDLMNRIMSGGRDGYWRSLAAQAVVEASENMNTTKILDIGTGTGDLARAMESIGNRMVIAADFSRPMLFAGQAKTSDLHWVQADALTLPFADESFDAVTSGFLLRNLVDLNQGLLEMVRVIKPGGILVALDITHAPETILGKMLQFCFAHILTPVAGVLSGQRKAYRYLPNSLDGFPNASTMTKHLENIGLEQVTLQRLGGGSIALHMGRKGEKKNSRL